MIICANIVFECINSTSLNKKHELIQIANKLPEYHALTCACGTVKPSQSSRAHDTQNHVAEKEKQNTRCTLDSTINNN